MSATPGTAFGHGGGGGGGGHGGGDGGHGGGGHFGGGRGGYGGHHGGYGGYGGYGWRGWRHGGYGYGYGGWGWWGGLGLGLYFATLPLYYNTYWWDGVPYYYADDTYYQWDPSVNQYETVAPPAQVAAQAQGQGSSDVIAYPKNGQSADQQAKDKLECHQWAASQSGVDLAAGATSSVPADKRSDYMRAEAACLEGRGYSVM